MGLALAPLVLVAVLVIGCSRGDHEAKTTTTDPGSNLQITSTTAPTQLDVALSDIDELLVDISRSISAVDSAATSESDPLK